MDPLTKNSAEFQAVFGLAVRSRLQSDPSRPGLDITDDVTQIINADPILRQRVHDYYQTILSVESRPDGSTYRSAPIEFVDGNHTSDIGHFAQAPLSPTVPDQLGTVRIGEERFADAVAFTMTLSHEMGGHFAQRHIDFTAGAATPEQYADGWLAGEGLSHLRQAQTARAAAALGKTLKPEDQAEVDFLRQEEARIGAEYPTASAESRDLLLKSAFTTRLSQAGGAYSRLEQAMEEAAAEFPTLLTANGEVLGIKVGRDESGNPTFLYKKGTILVEGAVDVNGMCRVYGEDTLRVQATVSPMGRTSVALFDASGSFAQASDEHVFDDGSSITYTHLSDGAVVSTTRDTAGVVVSETTQAPPAGAVVDTLLSSVSPIGGITGTAVVNGGIAGDGTYQVSDPNPSTLNEDQTTTNASGEVVQDNTHNAATAIVSGFIRPGDETVMQDVVDGTSLSNVEVFAYVPIEPVTAIELGSELAALDFGGQFALPTDPVVLDLNGDGVRLTSYADDAVRFDIDLGGDGVERSGWVSAADGLVVKDVNGNGAIDDAGELASEHFRGVAGQSFADGFAVLRYYDANGNNVLSAAEADAAGLKV